MFVIFPADELILMTYGPAIPRLAPRPTLDRLREPEVPIEIPLRSLSPPLPSVIATTTDTNKTTTNSSAVTAVATNSSRTAASQGVNSSNVSSANTTAPAHNSSASRSLNSGASAAAPVFTTAFTYDPSQPAQTTSQLLASNSLPPTPTRRNSRTSRTSLTHSASAVPAPDAAISKRSSVRSNRSNRSAHQQTPPSATQLQHQQQLLLLQHKQQQEYQHQQLLLQQQHQQEEQLLRHLQIQKHNNTSKRSNNSATTSQMQNDATDSSRSMQGRQVGPRPTLERGTAIRGATPQHGLTPQRGATPQLSYETEQLDEYAGATSLGGGGEQLISARDRSPSVFLEPPSPDPTQIIYGPGWGRPMSPMDLPPEPRPKSPTPSKSSRLRPKLHLPLGRLGRSTSTDQRESNRLKEDLQLLVDNPVFNCENLRQRNFDAFFESGEPKYKLQPMTPNSAPTGSLSSASSQYSPQIDGRSTKSAGGGGGGGGLFAPTPNEGKTAMNSRSRSTEQPVSPNRERRAASVSSGVVPQKDSSTKSSSGRKSRRFFGWRGPRSGSLGPRAGMASYNGVLKDYGHSSLNEAFKSQNNVNFKLIKTVSDFTETLSHLYEEHATALQSLVSNFRKKNAELRKERPACHQAIFQAWETFLQEVESDSQASNDVANVLSRQVSRPMLDKSFHRKVQSRKIFTHRESFETIIAKTEEKLSKCRLDYKQCYLSHRQNPTPLSLTEYIDAHNAYVQQLHATNAMLETYHCETVPQLMQELEEIHNDLCGIIAESIQQGADVIANKASDQAKRYGSLTAQCSAVSPMQDLTSFVRILPPLPTQVQKVPKRMFAPPQLPAEVEDNGDFNEMAPVLRNELVFDRHSTLSLRPALESLKREAHELEMQIRLLQDTVDGLNRTQQRGIEGQLYNKVNELQEELSLKKFDLRAKQLHFAAIKAQKELYASKVDPGSPRAERKLSAATAPSMKTKWLKAFRSLKPASGSAPADSQPRPNQMYHAVSTVLTLRRNGAAGSSSQPLRPNEDGSHHLQEYTYKKITACDVCSQILRGHTRQGLRCRICKLNAHGDCASQLPRCQPKQKLLRRQKSTSELENRVDVEDERPAEEGIRAPTPPPPLALQSKLPQQQQQTLADEENALPASPNANQTIGNRKFRQKVPFIDRIAQLAPHSPRRQKLNLRMKSLSLDSPESTELHGQIRRRQQPVIGTTTVVGGGSVYYHGGSGGHLEHNTPPSNNSRLHSPSSPSHQGRKLLYATRGMRGGSVDLPDEMEKSQSSASTSPCPSPVRQFQKSHRLLPTNLYVILYNFKARHADELDLKAGYKVTVIDTSDPDWWQGKLLGRVGYFPSKYCVRLNANEKPLQVTHNLQVSDGERGESMTLLRDQIVIQTGDEVNGMVMVRSADNRQGYCPVKYLQEV
ncbi:PREDICTED: uncharacterized protein LOC108973251 isoform X2 [Bactrocera latifrons]|uniref:uncharacterized protein LOC108973251 isoform X2 n=1 Tax=Bactrocera latifrons TaxID=174628 RepID=UPI0008DCBABF|nr:PREDICTED: uncharacterized protein LOC108973251 isoform X2 [Bactrocera latifrons]